MRGKVLSGLYRKMAFIYILWNDYKYKGCMWNGLCPEKGHSLVRYPIAVFQDVCNE